MYKRTFPFAFVLLIITNSGPIALNDRTLTMRAPFRSSEEMNGQETARETMTDATRRTFRRKGVPG